MADQGQSESVGARIKRLRLAAGLSQRELSSPGVTYAYISRIESGGRTPSVKALRSLAQSLGVSVEYLETGRHFPLSRDLESQLADAELRLRLDDDVEAVERDLNHLVQTARAAGDAYVAGRALLVLGFASFRRGDALTTVERIEDAIEIERPSPLLRPDVYGTLAQAFAALGAPARAVAVLERCLQDVARTAPHDVQTNIRYATLLSYALTDAGDLERAAEVVTDALARVDEGTDPYTRVRLHWSMARLAGVAGESGQSLDHIRRAIALLDATEDSVALARAHLLAANVQLDQNDQRAARDHVSRAAALFGASPLPLDLGSLLVLQSELADDADVALHLARRAIDVLGRQNAAERAAATRALARGLAMIADHAGAIDAYSTAVDLFAVHGRTADAAATCERLSDLLRKIGSTAEADEAQRRADELRGSTYSVG